MSPWGRILVAAAAIGLLVVAGAWWMRSGDAPDRAPPVGGAAAPAAVTEAAAESMARERAGVDATLIVRVTKGGRPVPATLSLTRGVHAVDAMTRPEGPETVHEVGASGSFEGTVSTGVWYGVRAVAAGSEAFAVLPPWSGRYEVDLELETGGIHALVLQSDLISPAHEGEIGVAIRAAPSSLRIDRRVAVEPGGHAWIPDLAPGHHVLLAPGAAADAGYPAVQVVPVGPGHPAQRVVVLVAPPTLERVELTLRADVDMAPGRRPRLFLRSIDNDSALWPLALDLEAGTHDTVVSVPRGKYRIGVVPTGAVDFVGGTPTLEVRGPTKYGLTVRSPQRRTELKLGGVGYGALPLRVAVWEQGDIGPADPDLVYFGPARWRRPQLLVPSLTVPVRIVAFGRGHAFVSRGPVQVDGAEAEAEMVPATRLTVRWTTWDRAPAAAVITVSTSVGDFARTLARRLCSERGAVFPVWSAEFFVPQEALRVECFGADGELLWTRSPVVKSWRESLAVGATQN